MTLNLFLGLHNGIAHGENITTSNELPATRNGKFQLSLPSQPQRRIPPPNKHPIRFNSHPTGRQVLQTPTVVVQPEV